MKTARRHRWRIGTWCLYDFANSAFTTLVVTFIYSTYFATEMVTDGSGATLWLRAVTISGLVVAFLSPLAGALADSGGLRRSFLVLSTGVAVLGSAALYNAPPGHVFMALFWFVVANVAFEMGMVFYNAYLPDISARNKIGRVSGYGWSLGYVGGLLAMGLAWVALVEPEQPWFGFSKEDGENIRATNLLVAVWFGLFSLPFLVSIRAKGNHGGSVLPRRDTVIAAYGRLASTFREIRKYREAFAFLVARMIYNDGLVTIFAFGGIYAKHTFDFSWEEVFQFGLLLNVSAGVGAFAFGFLDDLLGGKRTIIVSLLGLIVASAIAVLTHDRAMFWSAGILMGLLVGPNQSASRSLMGRFTPRDKEGEFFGLFAFSGKATAFLGPLFLGETARVFESQRVGVSVVILFFVVGGGILLSVNETEGLKRGDGLSQTA